MAHKYARNLITTTALCISAVSAATAQEAIMIVQHQVADFEEWKSVFDGGFRTRKSVGEMSFNVLQSPDDPNAVTVVFEWDTVERAKAFAADPALENGMHAAGVISVPIFSFSRISGS